MSHLQVKAEIEIIQLLCFTFLDFYYFWDDEGLVRVASIIFFELDFSSNKKDKQSLR